MGTVTDISAARAIEFVSQLSREHGARLLRFLQRMLGRREVAEDVAQEAYLKIYRLIRPEDVKCPRALLFDVATKLALDRMRQLRAEAAVTVAHTHARIEDELDTSPIEDVPDPSPLPDRVAILDDAMRRLTKVIDRLSPSLRRVFVLRYVMEMPREEIAARLNISIGAVEQRLTRALSFCRQELIAEGIDWCHG